LKSNSKARAPRWPSRFERVIAALNTVLLNSKDIHAQMLARAILRDELDALEKLGGS
jgi:hypothetical protein